MSMHSHHLPSPRSWLLWSICVGFLFMTGACSSTNPGEQKLLAQKKFEESMHIADSNPEKFKKLRDAIHLAPKQPMYRVALGNVYFKKMELEKAERMYLSAIKVDPEFRSSYRQLSRLYMQKSRWDDAIFYLNRALSFNNVIDPIQLYNWQGYCYYRKGDLAQSTKSWLKALDINENDQVRLNLALAYKQAQREDLAKASLLKALELNPKLLGAHFALGEIYYRSNKFALAKKHFDKVIHLEPMSDQARVSQKFIKGMSVKK